MLIEQARKFPVEFSAAIGNPDQLAAMIESGRQKAAETGPDPKVEVMKLLSQAQLAIDQENWQAAQSFVQQAKQIGVADEQFASNEIRPWQLELKIQNALNRQSFDPAVVQTTFDSGPSNEVVQAAYDPSNDTTRNIQISAVSDVPDSQTEQDFTPIPNDGLSYYRSGMKAIEAGDETAALAYFLKAWENRQPLDGNQRKAIKDQLTQLMPDTEDIPQATLASQDADLDIQKVENEYQVLFRKLQNEVFKERAAAERLLETNPRESLEKMTMVRGRIAQSNLNPESQRPLLTIIDRDITEMQKYIDQNLPDIMNDEANAARKDDVERRQQRRLDVEYQIQKLVEEFNDLVDEERFAEAQVVARQARELDPNSEMVALLTEKARFVERVAAMAKIKDGKEQGFYDSLRNVDEASIPWNDDKLIEFGDTETYLANARQRLRRQNANQYDSESERKIWNTLKTQQVQGEYRGTLAEAIDQLSRQAGVNIVFDDMALAAEGIQKDRTVDVPIRSPISLKSALEVILSTAGLVFVVDSEVIKVTSKDSQNTKLKTETYYIGDLVVPMNQNPDPTKITFNQPGRPNMGGNGVMNATANSAAAGSTNQLAMAQQMGNNFNGNPFNNMFGNDYPQVGVPTYATMGGQQFGGVTEADFQPLIELIQNTIQNESWLDTGQGLGTIEAFVPNLSLIVSQTQEVQDEIQDLLKKLRELNDVQIVIEVRFITLEDTFFERVGIDFDFAINDGNPPGFDPTADTFSPSTIVGRGPSDPFAPTEDLDIEFLQSSFNAAVPQFGNFQLANAANFGFAILSDIEVFFLIQASKGDARSNIMQAPTVTMFNGQSASVSDGFQRPFVTSVIPVVGDFAVAHQPVITILPEGANLNVQAVVSDDRRFVRLNMVPFFSQVTDVTTFTFDGSTTTERTTGSVLDDLLDAVDINGGDDSDEELVTTTQGITIQLPVVGFTSVNTVVSVPDGGTVLLGGIKRMSEGRLESGIPFLSNIPYVNRLFKNVGIGQETSNLMMMVTPRIIIQKELEEDQVGVIN